MAQRTARAWKKRPSGYLGRMRENLRLVVIFNRKPTSGTSGRSPRIRVSRRPLRYVSSRPGEALHPGRDGGGRRLRGLRRAVGEAGGERHLWVDKTRRTQSNYKARSTSSNPQVQIGWLMATGPARIFRPKQPAGSRPARATLIESRRRYSIRSAGPAPSGFARSSSGAGRSC